MPATTRVAERIESTFRNSRPPSVQTLSTVLFAFGAAREAQSSGRQGQRERGPGEPQEESQREGELDAPGRYCLLKKRTSEASQAVAC